MMYIRFPLSLRNVEDLLFERGIDICHETVRFWSNGFGPMITSEVRRQRVSHMRGFRHWRWHLDEMYVKLNGEMIYLWRAVDHEGEVLESYVTKSRDKEAALRFMKKTLKRYGSPERITTDGLGSYKAAVRELGNAPKQDIGRHANNRVKTVTCRFDDESEQCSAFGGWRHCRNSRRSTQTFTITSTSNATSLIARPSRNDARPRRRSGERSSAEPHAQRRTLIVERRVRIRLTAPFGSWTRSTIQSKTGVIADRMISRDQL
jgi:transposase-like protein